MQRHSETDVHKSPIMDVVCIREGNNRRSLSLDRDGSQLRAEPAEDKQPTDILANAVPAKRRGRHARTRAETSIESVQNAGPGGVQAPLA